MEVDRAIGIFAMTLIAAGVAVSVGRFSPVQIRHQHDAPVAIAPVELYALTPVPNPDSNAAPQPARNRPYRVAVTADASKAYVTLSGKEAMPGSEVVVIDVAAQRELKRMRF